MDSNDATAVHGGDISASNDNEEQSGAEWGGTKPRRVDTDLSRYFLSVSEPWNRTLRTVQSTTRKI